MALIIYRIILFAIIGLTIWLMVKPKRIPLNLSNTAKRVLLVPACFVAMFLLLGIFHLFGWDSEQVKASQAKKELMAKQEKWEQSIYKVLRDDSIKIANWSPSMDIERLEFIASIDSFRNSIAARVDSLLSDEEAKDFIKRNPTTSRLNTSNKETLHSFVKNWKLAYLNVYIGRFNSDTGLSVKIQRPDPQDNKRDWVILECVTSDYDLSENFINQLSNEVGVLGVKSIDYGTVNFNFDPKKRWEKEKSYSKHISCSDFDKNEWN